ncbi:DUF2490 domain-containing protein [Salegentibacter sediminis]|uniref:DUF2490 domain-containing protein n=1 Tax=Salegentibacter sediminis TaxID=1930251 RepID=UPI0009BE135A|nr:DUF2490 domain-containing protein [Salegentibacter sediminis]
MNKVTLRFIIIFVFLAGFAGQAQAPGEFYYESEFDLSFPAKKNWSIDLSFGNRGMLLRRENGTKTAGYQHSHIEFSQFTNYNFSEAAIISLGLRYRFKEIFDATEADEFRIIEQLELENAKAPLSLSQRFRLEQRFKKKTEHRLRYELGFSRPINQVWSFGIDTEFLYTMAKHFKPEAEQRFSIGLENEAFKNLEWEISLEYRLENYTRDLTHELFMVSGVNFILD